MSISDDFKAAGEQYAADIRAQREAAEHAREQAREQQQHITTTGGDWLKDKLDQLEADTPATAERKPPAPADDIFNHITNF